MSYYSVAIIKFQSTSGRKYLIERLPEGNSYQFIQYESSALGASFEFNSLVRFVERRLEIENLRIYSTKEFFLEREWQGRGKPATTVYVFTLSESLFNNLKTYPSFTWVTKEEINNLYQSPENEWVVSQHWIVEKVVAKQVDQKLDFDVAFEYQDYHSKRQSISDKVADNSIQEKFENKNPRELSRYNTSIEIQNVPILFIHGHPSDLKYVERLKTFLKPRCRSGQIQIFEESFSGQKITEYSNQAITNSDYILLFMSSDYLACDDCDFTARQALNSGKVCVPIILKACDWQLDYGHMKSLPHDGNPIISSSEQEDEIFYKVATAILKLVK